MCCDCLTDDDECMCCDCLTDDDECMCCDCLTDDFNLSVLVIVTFAPVQVLLRCHQHWMCFAVYWWQTLQNYIGPFPFQTSILDWCANKNVSACTLTEFDVEESHTIPWPLSRRYLYGFSILNCVWLISQNILLRVDDHGGWGLSDRKQEDVQKIFHHNLIASSWKSLYYEIY